MTFFSYFEIKTNKKSQKTENIYKSTILRANIDDFLHIKSIFFYLPPTNNYFEMWQSSDED